MPSYKYQNTAGRTLWYCSFYYTDWEGTRKRKVKRGFRTKKEAAEYENTYRFVQAKEPTVLFGKMVSEYMHDCELKLKPTTMQNKKTLIDTKILPVFGDTRLCDINANSVREWQNTLLAYRDPNGHGYEKTYLHTINQVFSGLMNYGVQFYGLSSNPCHVTGAIGSENAKEMKIWTQEQFERFIQCEDKPAYHAAFNVLFYGGLRKGELLALMPADLIPGSKAIRIRRNFETVKGVDLLTDPKTESSKRIVTLPGQVYEELAGWSEAQLLNDNERIFSFKYGGLWNEFRRCTAIAQLPVIRIHDLRHSHASMLIDMGFNMKQIADRLGHSNANTTMKVYAHLYPGRDIELAEKLEQAIQMQ